MSEENKWKSLPSMETPRRGYGATVLGEKIYVAGGDNYNDGGYFSSV